MRHTTKAVANKPTKMRSMVKTGDSYYTDGGSFVADTKPTPVPVSPADLTDSRVPPKEVHVIPTKPGKNRAVVKFKDQIVAEGGEVLNKQKGAAESGTAEGHDTWRSRKQPMPKEAVPAKSIDHASFANSQIPPDVPISTDLEREELFELGRNSNEDMSSMQDEETAR